MKRILLLYASVGAGHRSAAQAIEAVLKRYDDVEVRTEDALDHGSELYRQLYVDTYLELSEKAPEIWEYFYKLADEDDAQLLKKLRRFIDRLGISKLDQLVESFQPDAIICTHFLPLHILAEEKSKGNLTIPLYGVVTDYTGHVYWVHPSIDRYFAATDTASDMLVQRGVDENIITLSGIPIDPTIAETKDPQHMREKHQIQQTPVVLLMGSALSTKRVQRIVSIFREQDMLHGTLLIAAGRNEELAQAMHAMQSTETLEIRLLDGFVTYLDDLVAASDLVITKAGGLIVSEILARHTPMVVIDPIPGQEEWNADYIVSVGAGVQVRLADMVPSVVQNLLADTQQLQIFRENARQHGKPRAAFAVAETVLEGL